MLHPFILAEYLWMSVQAWSYSVQNVIHSPQVDLKHWRTPHSLPSLGLLLIPGGTLLLLVSINVGSTEVSIAC